VEEDLISKKELLEITGISYGQLYRWKRKGLIPEEWFIKKSSFTGQETYFPKSKVLSRIDKIKYMKEDISLNDLADVFSPAPGGSGMRVREAVERGIASSGVCRIFPEFSDEERELGFNDILSLHILNKLILSGDINAGEAQQLGELLSEGLRKFESQPGELVLTRKLGVFGCFMVSPPCGLLLDGGTRLVSRLNLAALIEEVKLKLV